MKSRGMSLYYAFLAAILITILIAPLFSSTLEQMSMLTYGATCGAATFILLVVYQGIAAKLGALPFRPSKWILRLFRVRSDTPARR